MVPLRSPALSMHTSSRSPQSHMEVEGTGDSCKAQCYVVHMCWNSQINGRGSSPNQGSIPGYILVLWAVILWGRHQYLLLLRHSNRQNKRRLVGGTAVILVPHTSRGDSYHVQEILLFMADILGRMLGAILTFQLKLLQKGAIYPEMKIQSSLWRLWSFFAHKTFQRTAPLALTDLHYEEIFGWNYSFKACLQITPCFWPS